MSNSDLLNIINKPWLDINDIKPGPIYSFLENVFLEMMHEVEQGKNVFIGNDLFIEKNSAYQHMMKADLSDVE